VQPRTLGPASAFQGAGLGEARYSVYLLYWYKKVLTKARRKVPILTQKVAARNKHQVIDAGGVSQVFERGLRRYARFRV
jgi:hypothetical protein